MVSLSLSIYLSIYAFIDIEHIVNVFILLLLSYIFSGDYFPEMLDHVLTDKTQLSDKLHIYIMNYWQSV